MLIIRKEVIVMMNYEDRNENIIDGFSEKEAIKRVAFERKIQKSIVYKEYHLNK